MDEPKAKIIENKFLWGKWSNACADLSMDVTEQGEIQISRWFRVLDGGYSYRLDNPFFGKPWIITSLMGLSKYKDQTILTPMDMTSVTVALWFSRFNHNRFMSIENNRRAACRAFMEFLTICPPKRTPAAIGSYKTRVLRCLTEQQSSDFTDESNYNFRIYRDCTQYYLAARPETYQHWTNRLRMHQSFMTDEAWLKDRIERITKTLLNSTIYISPTGQRLWENHARQNLMDELDRRKVEAKKLGLVLA